MNENDKGGYENFLDSIRVIKDRITRRQAYFGVLIGSSVFAVSLFLTWSQARNTFNLADTGLSSGWHEGAYWAFLPFLYLLVQVAKNKPVGMKPALGEPVAALIILLYNNVIYRSSWFSFGRDYGSDLGFGFWVGFLSLVTVGVCGVAWAFHTTDKLPEEIAPPPQQS